MLTFQSDWAVLPVVVPGDKIEWPARFLECFGCIGGGLRARKIKQVASVDDQVAVVADCQTNLSLERVDRVARHVTVDGTLSTLLVRLEASSVAAV